MAFKISFVSDVREVVRGNEAMEKGLDATADSLDDMARAAQTAGRKTGNELDGIGDDAQDAAKKLERKFRDALEDVAGRSKRAGDDVGDNVKKGAKKAEDATGEFKDEAKQNFSEVASSFSGDMDGAIDLVQGTLGGLAGSIPGIGIAAGAAAAGIGAVYSVLSDQAEKTKERISAMTEALASGAVESFITDELTKIFTGADDAAISMANLREAVEETGVSQSTLARAWAGDQTARVEALDAISAAYAAAQEKASSTDMRTRQQGEAAVAELGRWKGALEDMGDGFDTATTNAQGLSAALRDVPASTNTDVNVNTQPGRIGLGDFRRDLVAAQTVPLTVDTTQADRDIDAWARRPRRVGVSIAANIMQPV